MDIYFWVIGWGQSAHTHRLSLAHGSAGGGRLRRGQVTSHWHHSELFRGTIV
jgi:hypothetical protein